MATVVLPGDEIPPSLLPASRSRPLTLGPGLLHTPPSAITATLAGALSTDTKKNAIWLEYNGGRYIPAVNDLVIVTVHHTSVDTYHCAITPYASFATLPQLAFEGATKKTRPILAGGALVYARVTSANKFLDPELECLNPSTGKADGLGPLKGGMLFDITLGMARRLLMKDNMAAGTVVLEELGEKAQFEIAVGRNGKLWVNSGSTTLTLAVGKAVTETDQKGLSIDEQRKLVRGLLKGL